MIGRSSLGVAWLALSAIACYPDRAVDSTTEFASVTTLYDKTAPFASITKTDRATFPGINDCAPYIRATSPCESDSSLRGRS